ncbi:MAG: hypothetical protein H6760_00535 [Candidatus Nomurabacteria bacterium]|nr:MAG: hypothetical protein H6760_00535 [Candidatus Nomurabacteria bacterium]
MWKHSFIVILTCLFFLFGVGFAIQTSTFNAPDERGHYLYVQYVHETGLLPVLSADSPNKEAHQPPLYYWLSQPVFSLTQHWSERAQVLALRFWSLILSSGVVLLTYAAIRRLLPTRRLLAYLATVFVALNPQFLFMSSVINNDALTNLLGAAWVFAIVFLFTRQSVLLKKSTNVWMVLLAAAMFLTKASLWPLVALLGLVHFFRVPISERKRVALYWIPALLIMLWWLTRNTLIYGDPTVHQVQHDLWYAEQHRNFLSPSGVWQWLVTLVESFWARFAYFNIALPGIFYLFIKLGLMMGAIGFLRYTFQHWSEKWQPRMQAIWILCLGALSVFVGVFWYSLSFYQPQGRYLFAVLPVFSALLSLGLLVWLPKKLQWLVFALIVVALVLADVKSYALLSKYG